MKSDFLSAAAHELLDLSRIEARQGKDLDIVSCPLAALVESTVGGLHYKAEKHRVVCDLRHGAFTMLADPEKTRQALLNVLSNAVKYSPLGGHCHHLHHLTWRGWSAAGRCEGAR